MALELDRDGAQHFSQILSSDDLHKLLAVLPPVTGAGERIYGSLELTTCLMDGPVGRLAKKRLGAAAKPVRAILFDKTAETNWALTWHQDRTIAAQSRIETPGFTNWNRKAGAAHVEPPFDVIERMLTARIHLDRVPADNAPLLIAPGSHLLGRLEDAAISAVVAQCGRVACLADAGDVWLYRTAILHASERARGKQRRRVLQVDFSAEDLPGELDWLGLG